MSVLLYVPAKKGSDIDVSKPLKNLIASTYSSSDNPVDVSSALQEFQKLRQNSIRIGGENRGESAYNAIANYYDQIVQLEQKIPAQEVQIPFKWKDAFDRGSIFGGRISLTVPSLAYEKVCVLFNLGAVASSIAAEQNTESDEGLQKAMKKLQVSAGIFGHLKETVVGAIQQDPTPDLEPETLGVISELMLAQAQEMVVQKAILDKMKDAIIVKLAGQCEEMYASVMKSMQKENVRTIWDPSWLPNVSGKQAIYNGLAQYHRSRACNTEKIIGEEIARLQYAKTLFTAGIERGSNPDLCQVKEWLKRTERYLADALKDNDFIYHERIPDVKNLPAVGKAAVAKPTPMTPKMGNGGGDIFGQLMPVAVHQAVSTYEVRKNEIVNGEAAKLKDATVMLNELLNSMNLPAALEDTSGGDIPQSVKDKSRAVQDAGGTQELGRLMNELPELLQRNTEILDECERLLREEKQSDDQLRGQFKERWNRTPSDSLTATFKSNAEKYRTIINNATEADKIVKEKYETHRVGFELLMKSSTDLKTSVPSSGTGNVKKSPTVAKLKELMEDIETLKAERQVIEAELKSTNPDIKSVFLEALARGELNEPVMSTESLGRAFGPLQKQAADNIARQESLIDEVQKNNEKFVAETGGQGSAREDKLKQIAAAHDAFFELKGNLTEGTKFYNDLTQLLVTFQNKVTDFCFARKTEKEELMKDLTSSMAGLSMGAGPTPPAHHTPPVTTGGENPSRPARKNDPPPRPPPPNVEQPAASASAPNPYAGAPANPYAGAPPNNPYAGAPPHAAAPLPYPQQPGMPMPYQQYTPMPGGYNPYAGAPPAGYPPQPAQYYPPYQGYPPQYPQQPGYPPQYPPQNPGQQPQWR